MPDPGWINASGGAPAYTAAETRQLMALALQYNGRVLGARAGVRPGGTALNTELSGSTITVRAGTACVDPALTTTQGPYWVALPADETHTLTAAHATLPRKDITILRVYDHDEDASGLRLARSEYLTGTAAASPAEPAVPAGAFRLATLDVPASGGGSPTVTINYPVTVAAGGVVPVRTQAERDALTAFDGMVAYRRDRDWIEIHDGTAWRVPGTAVCSSTTDRDSAITHPYNGQLAYTSDTGKLHQRHGSAWREFPAVPRAQLRQSSTHALTVDAYTAIQFNAEDRDSHNGHSTVTNNTRYTIQLDGDYWLAGGVAFASGAGFRATEWRKNGSTLSGSGTSDTATSGATWRLAARTILVPNLVVGDYLELWAFTDVAIDTSVAAGAESTMTVLYAG